MTAEQVGCNEADATGILENSLEELITQVTILPDWHEHNSEITEERETHVGEACSPPAARRSSRNKRAKLSPKSSAATTPGDGTMEDREKPLEETDSQEEDLKDPDPFTLEPKTSIYNKIEIEPIKNWIGNQLTNQNIS